MAKVVPDAFIDNGLSYDTTLNEVHVCAGQPTSYADVATKSLATASLPSSPTLGAGSPDGRQSNIPAKSGITISTSGTADHIAYRDTTNSRYIVTTCTSTSLTSGSGNTVSVDAVTRVIRAVT